MKSLLFAALISATALVCEAHGQTTSPDVAIKRPAVFCQGTYALCIRARCTPASSGDYVDCGCVVEQGWSMGPGSCESRKDAAQNGTPISTYSNLFNNVDKTLTCANPQTKWAWCYGAPCTVDPHDPKTATCTCPVKTSPMRTLGGSCDHGNCSQMWSAATPNDDAFANQHFYHYMKEHHPKYPTNPPALACFNKRI
jgi:hypothetical protein